MRCKLGAIRGTMGRAKTTLIPLNPWAARYNTGLLIKLTPKGVVFSFLFLWGLCRRHCFRPSSQAYLIVLSRGKRLTPPQNSANLLHSAVCRLSTQHDLYAIAALAIDRLNVSLLNGITSLMHLSFAQWWQQAGMPQRCNAIQQQQLSYCPPSGASRHFWPLTC